METQVAEFEESELEWVIDKVLSHSGRWADSSFEILWKTGDVSWLPHDQIAELDTLKDYFAILGIDDVSQLGEGAGDPPNEDPQVTVGHLSLAKTDYRRRTASHPSSKSPTSSSTLEFLNNIITHVALSINATTMAPILTRIGTCRYSLPNGLGNGDLMVMLDMLHSYLEYDCHLRAGTAADLPSPVGYGDFSLSFNMLQTTNGLTSRFAEESSDGPRISGPSPSIINLIGEEAPPAPPIHTSVSQPPDGGRWLNPHRVELVEEALWQNMAASKRQREWRERSIAERKAAKRAHYPRHSPSHHQNNDKGEGSSGSPMTNSAPRTPSIHMATTPKTSNPPQSQMDVDDQGPSARPKDASEDHGKSKAKKK
jgi:hypothetical protein